MVAKGDAVVVVAGRKVPVGTTGKVFWTGMTKYGMRVGLKEDATGATLWTAMGNVEVAAAPAPVAPAPVVDEPTPGVSPTLEKKVEALLALTNLLAAGMMTLEKEVAALKAAAAKTATPAPMPMGDYGNAMEHRMVLDEMAAGGDVAAAAELLALDAAIAAARGVMVHDDVDPAELAAFTH